MSDKKRCEYLRQAGRDKFDLVRDNWLDLGSWAAPWRTTWLSTQEEGVRKNRHIVDTTHIAALRSFVAGHLEGNTSSTRPWYRLESNDDIANQDDESKDWLKIFTRRTHKALHLSNFYDAGAVIYYDYGVFNTSAAVIEEMDDGRLFFHNLDPGSYFVINDAYGDAMVLTREFTLTVKALVESYGVKDENGKFRWDNFSKTVKNAYNNSNYNLKVDIAQVIEPNQDFNPNDYPVGLNREWISRTYEIGSSNGSFDTRGYLHQTAAVDDEKYSNERFLRIKATRRKPFIVPKSKSSNNYPYGEMGPTLDALGLIKSLNKKAVTKDMALEQMIRPTMQGPAGLKKSYLTHQPGKYIPMDATALSQKGARRLFEINPAIAALAGDVQDLRDQVSTLYYADYLLYLSRNPKTRTATETDAIVKEQQLIIGPNLQSLNKSFNIPVVDYVSHYVLENDPYLPPIPDSLAGKFVKPEFISVFAQAQRAADLPAVDRYMAMVAQVGQIRPEIWDKANIDRLADLYEDRLYLPVGLNNPQDKVDAMREQAQAQAAKQQQMDQVTQMAGAAKDLGVQANTNREE